MAMVWYADGLIGYKIRGTKPVIWKWPFSQHYGGLITVSNALFSLQSDQLWPIQYHSTYIFSTFYYNTPKVFIGVLIRTNCTARPVPPPPAPKNEILCATSPALNFQVNKLSQTTEDLYTVTVHVSILRQCREIVYFVPISYCNLINIVNNDAVL